MLRNAISGPAARNSHAHVVHGIGLAIVSGQYPVGTMLPGDLELAEQFHVSRTVLREAMKTLSAKGMVLPRAGVGTRVTERTAWNFFDADVLSWHIAIGIDSDFLGHLFDMRRAFEPQAARLAAERNGTADVSAMRRAAEAMRTAPTIEEFSIADLQFHLAVLDASGNPVMHSVGTVIEAALVAAFKLSSPAHENRETVASAHERIADAIESGDPPAAEAAARSVIDAGLVRVAGRLTDPG